MRHNRPNPTFHSRGLALIAVAIGSIASTLGAESPTPAVLQGRAGEQALLATQGSSPAMADLTSLRGQDVIALAVGRLQQYGGIGCRVRYRVEIFNQALVGSGNYYQGTPGSRHSRMELKLQAANKTCSHLQVCDGQTLWTYEQFPESRKLTRVNVEEVLAALAQSQQPASPLGMGIGGLPELLRRLDQSIEFAPPQQGKLGNWPVLRLEGRLKPETLVKLLPKQKEAIEAGEAPDLRKLPPQAPYQVVLYLGQADLFPYRLEFDRGPASKQEQPMLVMEFFEVQFNLAVDPERFTYKPSYRNIQDVTAKYIEQLR